MLELFVLLQLIPIFGISPLLQSSSDISMILSFLNMLLCIVFVDYFLVFLVYLFHNQFFHFSDKLLLLLSAFIIHAVFFTNLQLIETTSPASFTSKLFLGSSHFSTVLFLTIISFFTIKRLSASF